MIIIRVEIKEERDFQFTRLRGIGYLGVSVGSLADIIRRIALASPVLHTNRTVGTKRVSGRDIYQPVFKTVLVAGYFVPKSHISVQVERGDRGVIRTFKKTFDSKGWKNGNPASVRRVGRTF